MEKAGAAWIATKCHLPILSLLGGGIEFVSFGSSSSSASMMGMRAIRAPALPSIAF